MTLLGPTRRYIGLLCGVLLVNTRSEKSCLKRAGLKSRKGFAAVAKARVKPGLDPQYPLEEIDLPPLI
jgi:hypothetical protein